MDNNESYEIGKKIGSSRLIPVTQWEEYHVWPPIGGLRHLIRNASDNGFDECLLKIGRRLLVDEERFLEWARRKKFTD